MSKLFVSNLPYKIEEDEVKDLFSDFGEVKSVKIITDRETGRSKGFGFVEMDNFESAAQALNGRESGGRAIRVEKAREREGGNNRSYRGGSSSNYGRR